MGQARSCLQGRLKLAPLGLELWLIREPLLVSFLQVNTEIRIPILSPQESGALDWRGHEVMLGSGKDGSVYVPALEGEETSRG